MWMPARTDLKALGYSGDAVKDLWLPPNLASANAQARAWQQVVAYQNTLVGLPPVPVKGAPAPAAPASGAPASGAPAAPATATPSKKG